MATITKAADQEQDVYDQQAELLPEEPHTTKLKAIPVDDIQFEDIGPPATPDLIASVKARGVISPITVREMDDHYRLIAGRRRLKASLAAGFDTIPALIISGGENQEDLTVALTDHALRKRNVAADLRHAEDLFYERQYTEKAISKATGLTVGQIRALLKIGQKLQPVLREAFDAGKMPVSVAMAATKLSAADQETLAERLEESGRVTAKDVKQMRRVQQVASTEEMPFDELDDVPDSPGHESVEHENRASLDQFIAQVGVSPTDPHGLAAVGIACLDTGRYDDARAVLERIVTLGAQSA